MRESGRERVSKREWEKENERKSKRERERGGIIPPVIQTKFHDNFLKSSKNLQYKPTVELLSSTRNATLSIINVFDKI